MSEVFAMIQEKMREFEGNLEKVSQKLISSAKAEWLNMDENVFEQNLFNPSVESNQDEDNPGRVKVYSPEALKLAEAASQEAEAHIKCITEYTDSNYDYLEGLKLLYLGKFLSQQRTT